MRENVGFGTNLWFLFLLFVILFILIDFTFALLRVNLLCTFGRSATRILASTFGRCAFSGNGLALVGLSIECGNGISTTVYV